MKDERDDWSKIHEIMHPASGAQAILCTLVAVGGVLNLTGAPCKVGIVGRMEPAANSSPWVTVVQSETQPPPGEQT